MTQKLERIFEAKVKPLVAAIEKKLNPPPRATKTPAPRSRSRSAASGRKSAAASKRKAKNNKDTSSEDDSDSSEESESSEEESESSEEESESSEEDDSDDGDSSDEERRLKKEMSRCVCGGVCSLVVVVVLLELRSSCSLFVGAADNTGQDVHRSNKDMRCAREHHKPC